MTQDPTPDARRRLFERAAAQAQRVEDKQTAYLRERDRLDRLVAEAVSAKPESPQWYAYPGELSIEDVVSAIGGGPGTLARLMDRYRKAEAKAAATRRKTRTSTRTLARRAATQRAHTP